MYGAFCFKLYYNVIKAEKKQNKVPPQKENFKMLNANVLGSRVAAARKKNGMSQTELADAVSISPQMVSKWERGESLPDVVMLTVLAEILQTDVNYLIYGQEKARPINSETEQKEQETAEDGRGMKKDARRQKLFKKVNWKDMDFAGSDLRDKKFDFSNLEKCDFSACNLLNGSFRFSHVKNCSFDKAGLENADFSMSDVSNCGFGGARLNGAQIDGGDFHDCGLQGADFSDMTAKRSLFKNCAADGVIIKDVLFEECQFVGVEFKNIDFKNVIFKNCALKKTAFTDCAMDKITYNFLKACKADLTGVKYA